MSTLTKTVLATIITIAALFSLLIIIIVSTMQTSKMNNAILTFSDHKAHFLQTVESTIKLETSFLNIIQQSLIMVDPENERIADISENILTTMIDSSLSVYSAWLIIDKNYIDGVNYSIKEYMRRNGSIYENNTIDRNSKLNDAENSSWYFVPFTTGNNFIDNVCLQIDEHSAYAVSISVPIRLDGSIIGVCGVDILYMDIFEHVYVFDENINYKLLLLDQDLTILYSSFDNAANDGFSLSLFYDLVKKYEMFGQNREYSSMMISPVTGEQSFISISAVSITENIGNYFFLYFDVPLNTLYSDINEIVTFIVIASIICLILIIFIVYKNLNKLIKPIRKLTNYANQVAINGLPSDINLSNPVLLENSDRDNEKQNEITILTHAFNSLLSNVYKNIQLMSEVEERILLMLDTSPLCCQIWDRNFHTIDCNEAAVKLYKLKSKQEYIDRFFELSPEYQNDGQRSDEKARQFLNKAFEEGYCVFNWTHRLPEGTLLPAEITLVRAMFKEEYVVLGYTRDMREVKAAEAKMFESMEKARELEVKTQAAQAASEAKSRFLATMSHEIRTPMNAVIGMSELLLSDDLTRQQRQHVEDLKTSAMALLNIINNILDISKIQAAKFELSPVHYNFEALLDNISSMSATLIGDKNIQFEVVLQTEIPKCLYGDDIRLRQVLLNILSNAFKYTNEGSVTLEVTRPLVSDQVTFIVTDTGIGIPQKAIPTLFDAFEQVDSLTNRSQEGTGLGLAITKALIELMGGTITVESVYGKGTSFQFSIPVIPGDEKNIHLSGDDKTIICSPDTNVLAVDDRMTNLSVISGLLALSQITAHTAMSGRQAIDMAMQNQYDLIFMDHMMPEMDGVETTRLLRENGIKTPIIALTANAVSGVKEMLLSAGMNDFLSKPILRSSLNTILQNWIPAEKLRESPSTTGENAEASAGEEKDMVFWEKIKHINEISMQDGLKTASGQKDMYKKSLAYMLQDLKNCPKKLQTFLADGDMHGFSIEVHGMKGSLANIGAREIAALAGDLENASNKKDIAFCTNTTPEFIYAAEKLMTALEDAFVETRSEERPVIILPELRAVFEAMTNAFKEMDVMTINNELKKLDAMDMSSTLQVKIEQIKDAVMVMDYDNAAEIMASFIPLTYS